MVEGGGSRDFHRVKLWAYRDAEGFSALIDLLVEQTIALLAAEIDAGVDAVQLFDSWAGILPEAEFERWVVAPTRRIVAGVRRRHPQCPIIGFPRGAGLHYERYAEASGVDAIGLDTTVPLGFARDRLQARGAVQGNLDPVLLAAGGDALVAAARAVRRALASGPHVFNLGHGVLPQTPPENVALLARILAEPEEAGPQAAR
jgi:uroporphyrinogen decarboxylase